MKVMLVAKILSENSYFSIDIYTQWVYYRIKNGITTKGRSPAAKPGRKDMTMTKKEVKDRVIRLFETGHRIESEVHYIDEDGVEKKARILAGNTGYKWRVIYTRNANNVFTASDVQCFDAYSGFGNHRRDISYKVF